MSRKRRKGAKATAASMVMDTLKKRGAVDEKSAVDVSVFKNLPYATSTISYTISNLIEEGVVGKTNDERFYYDDLGFKALETKFVRGYSMIFIVPIVIAILVYVLQKVLHPRAGAHRGGGGRPQLHVQRAAHDPAAT